MRRSSDARLLHIIVCCALGAACTGETTPPGSSIEPPSSLDGGFVGAGDDLPAPSPDADPRDTGSNATTDAVSADPPESDSAIVDSGKKPEPPLDTGTKPGPTDTGTTEPPGTTVGKSVHDVTFTNVRGEVINARLLLPAGTTTSRHPAVIVLHGSGGLFKDPTSADLAAGRVCSSSMSSQFDRWAERLNARGYVAIFPDSFGSRGYCDEVTDPRREKVLPPVPGDENGKTRRLISRVYDLDQAARYLCGHGRVKCDALGVVGFSNGGSAIALGIHHKIAATFAAFAGGARAKSIGVKMPALPSPAPNFRVGIAYYPGCGFDGLMSESTSTAQLEDFLYPRADLQVLIGQNDALLEHCSKQAIGTREIQADTYAATKGLPDRYHVKVYSGAAHSFDAAGCEKAGADMTNPDIKACTDAVAVSMDLLKRLETP